MTKLPKTPTHWNLVTSTLNGALLGLMAAMTYNFVNAYYGYIPKEDVGLQVFAQTTLLVAAGALLFALVSAIRNRHKRNT